jgi:translation initiation factor 2B subunit (eIF-2B alpha/beta/delta family)
MEERHRSGVEALAADTTSGATDLVLRAAELLLAVAGDRATLLELAAACVEAQPAMAGLLSLERVIRQSADADEALRRFVARLQRSPTLIARHAVPLLLLGAPLDPASGRAALTVATLSRSLVVQETVRLLAAQAGVRACCSEGRPMREGVALAGVLAAIGVQVELLTDAALSSVIPQVDAVLVGADAVSDDWIVNKVGTGAVCALALHLNVPVYVLAGSEKRLSAAEFARLHWSEGPPTDLLSSPLTGVTVVNPYFERIPISLVSHLITDAGQII